MKEFKGTKAPWRKTANIVLNNEFVVATDNEIICRLNVADFNTDEEAGTNANLIAAAPELLKALRDIVKWSAHLPPASNAEIESAKAAIEKATK